MQLQTTITIVILVTSEKLITSMQISSERLLHKSLIKVISERKIKLLGVMVSVTMSGNPKH